MIVIVIGTWYRTAVGAAPLRPGAPEPPVTVIADAPEPGSSGEERCQKTGAAPGA